MNFLPKKDREDLEHRFGKDFIKAVIDDFEEFNRIRFGNIYISDDLKCLIFVFFLDRIITARSEHSQINKL